MSLRARYGLFFLATYVVFLVATLPAAHIVNWASARGALPGEFYQVDGTLWRGRAAMLRAADVTLERPAWCFRPAALLLGGVEFSLTAALGAGTLETTAGRSLDGSLHARDLHLAAPLRELARIAGQPDMGLTGRATAAIDRLRLKDGMIRELRGTIELASAGIGPPLNVVLGGLVLQLEPGADGVTTGTLRDTGGPLQAEGTLTVQPSGEYRIEARLAAREAGRNGLSRALDLIGTPDREGRYAVRYEGRVRIPGA